MSASGPQKFTFDSVIDILQFFGLCSSNIALFHEHLDDLKQQIKDNNINLSDSSPLGGTLLIRTFNEYPYEINEFIVEQFENPNIWVRHKSQSLLQYLANQLARQTDICAQNLYDINGEKIGFEQGRNPFMMDKSQFNEYFLMRLESNAKMKESLNNSLIIFKKLLSRTTDIDILSSLDLNTPNIDDSDRAGLEEALLDAKLKADCHRPTFQYQAAMSATRSQAIEARFKLLEEEWPQMEWQANLTALNNNRKRPK